MKRRARVQPDPERIVVIPDGMGAPLVVARQPNGVTVEGAWAPLPEGARPPCASLIVLPPGEMLCRTVELPDAPAAQLDAALRLQVEALQSPSMPAWRIGASVLGRASDGRSRTGLVLEWPTTSEEPLPPRDLPPDNDPLCAGDTACLAALLQAGAQGPLVNLAADHRRVSFALRMQGRSIIRSVRLDADAWPSIAETAVLESALHAGADADVLRSLLDTLREALANCVDGGFGCTESDRSLLNGKLDAPRDASWWRETGLAAGAAMAWFGPLRPLVSLRAQAPGERPSRFGELLNRLGEPLLAKRLALAGLAAVVLLPPLVAGARLLLLEWKVGDLAARERAIQSHRQRVSMYQDLLQRAWPMGELLGTLACVTPEGVEWTDLKLSQDRNVLIRGTARSQDGMDGTEVILKMEHQLADSRVFDKVTKKWDSPDGKGLVKFSMNAVVVRPTLRPNFGPEQDFGKKSLAERRYGPEKPDDAAATSGDEPSAPEPVLAKDAPAPAATESEAPPTVAAHSGEQAPPAPETKSATGKAPRSLGKPSNKDMSGRKATADASSDTAGDGENGGRKGVRRGSTSSASSGGMAKRGDRASGTGDSQVSVPPPLTDAQIDAMTKSEALEAVSKVSEARNRAAVDDETKKRLKGEFDKLMAKIRAGGGT